MSDYRKGLEYSALVIRRQMGVVRGKMASKPKNKELPRTLRMLQRLLNKIEGAAHHARNQAGPEARPHDAERAHSGRIRGDDRVAGTPSDGGCPHGCEVVSTGGVIKRSCRGACLPRVDWAAALVPESDPRVRSGQRAGGSAT